MKGMIKKDLLMVKNNYKSILISLVIFIFYSITFKMDMSFILPFMGLMVCISTINYDEYNNWHTYATTLPQGKINVVKSKYLTTIAITLLLTIVSLILSLIIGSGEGTLKIDDTLATIFGELIAIMFMMSILFPVLFKYGSEKGRLAMIIIGLAIFGIVFLFKKIFVFFDIDFIFKNMFNIELSNSIINFLDLYFPIIFGVVSVILILISYYISKKVYLNREF